MILWHTSYYNFQILITNAWTSEVYYW
jgi:hypothetical protein